MTEETREKLWRSVIILVIVVFSYLQGFFAGKISGRHEVLDILAYKEYAP